MGADIPTIEPKEHQAGTTLVFERSLPDFPADTWTLTYNLRSTTNAPIDISAAANGQSHRVTEAFGDTADWNAGEYIIVGYVTKSDDSERHQIYSGRITITAYAAGEGVYEWRSYAERMLEKIEAVILGRMDRDDSSYSINGRSFTPKTDEDLLRTRAYFRAEVAREKRSKKGGKILGRFKAPR